MESVSYTHLDVYKRQLLDIDSAVGRDLLTDSILARPPDIDYHFVTGAKAVIQGGGDITLGSKVRLRVLKMLRPKT